MHKLNKSSSAFLTRSPVYLAVAFPHSSLNNNELPNNKDDSELLSRDPRATAN